MVHSLAQGLVALDARTGLVLSAQFDSDGICGGFELLCPGNPKLLATFAENTTLQVIWEREFAEHRCEFYVDGWNLENLMEHIEQTYCNSGTINLASPVVHFRVGDKLAIVNGLSYQKTYELNLIDGDLATRYAPPEHYAAAAELLERHEELCIRATPLESGTGLRVVLTDEAIRPAAFYGSVSQVLDLAFSQL